MSTSTDTHSTTRTRKTPPIKRRRGAPVVSTTAQLLRWAQPVLEEDASGGVRHRETLMRRALAAADVLAALAAVVLLIAYAGGHGLRPGTLLLAPVVVAIHKIAGLYDRDELVLRKSTLDEAPALLSSRPLYTLLVWLLATALLDGHARPRAGRSGSGRCSCPAGVLGAPRAPAASRARVAPAERCLVIGEPARPTAIARKLDERRASGVERRRPLMRARRVDDGCAGPTALARAIDATTTSTA